MDIKKAVCVVSFLLSSGATFSARVAPVFSGFWYDAADISATDSCGHNIYTYKHKEKDSTTLVQRFINNPPPKGSGYGISSKTHNGVCITPTPPCLADIVGRDLDAPIIGKAGHVGLIAGYSENYQTKNSQDSVVLEVLNKDTVVQENSLDSFEKATKYWGERYGLKNKSYITQDEANNIIKAGQKEELPSCRPDYSYGWDYVPCGVPGSRPKFRCDSFVYYSYLKGANIQITDGTHINFPNTIFYDRFINWRYNAENTVFSLSKSMAYLNKSSIEKIDVNTTRDEEETINEIFNGKLLDLRKADYATKKYVKDGTISRSKKLAFLWKLALKHQTNIVKFNYIESLLSYLHPIELTSQLIDLFYKQSIFQNKIEVISMLISAHGAIYHPVFSVKYNKDIYKIRKFFRNLLFKSNDNRLFQEALLNYPKVADPKVAYNDIQKAITRPDMQDFLVKTNFLNKSYFFYSQLRLILSDQHLQNVVLPKLLSHMQKEKADILSRFNKTLFYLLEDYNGENINNLAKSKLINYLLADKPKFKVTSLLHWKEADDYYTWLKCYASVKANSKNQKARIIINFILNTDKVIYKSILISKVDQTILKQATTEEILQMKAAISPLKPPKNALLMRAHRKVQGVELDYQRAQTSYFISAKNVLNKALSTK